MKKIILCVLSFALLLSTTTVAYAAYNYVSPSVGSVGYNYAQMLTQQTGYRILDVDPHGYISYIVTISYDDLSNVCTTANGIGLSCSLYYNAYIDRYVIDIDDKALFGLTSTYGAIGNVDGNVLVAEADKTSETLDNILTALVGNNNGVGGIRKYVDEIADVSWRISSKLDDLIDVISKDGKLLVDNSDVVAAIQSIPAFDDTAIINAIQSIPAFDDAGIIAAIKAIPSYNSGALYDKVLRVLNRLDILYSDFTDVASYYFALSEFYSTYDGGHDIFFLARQRTYDVFQSLYDWMDFYSFTGSSSLDFWEGLYSNVGDISAIRDSIRNSVVPAIKAIPAFDDADVITAIGRVENALSNVSVSSSFDDADIISAIENIPVYKDTNVTTSITRMMNTLNGTLTSIWGQFNTPITVTDVGATSAIYAVDASVNSLNTDLSANLNSLVDKLQVVVDNSTSTVENTVINITEDNDAFNVFYIEGNDGNTQSVTKFAGDLTGASGKLLSLLYRLVFADALGGVDGDLDGFEDFFTSQEPVAAMQGMDDTVNEVLDVWAS